MAPETYWLRASFNHDAPTFELAVADVEKLRHSKQCISSALRINEMYKIIVDDYLEFEKCVLSAALDHSVKASWRDEHFNTLRMLFNRRLLHILTAARSYLEVTPKLIPEIAGNASPGMLSEFHHRRSAKHDALLGYRFMEQLRNSAQHYGLPIHGFSIGSQWDAGPNSEKRKHRHLAVPLIDIETLASDPRFKKSVLEEIRLRGARLDVRPFLREYVYGISHLNHELHSATLPFLFEAESNIRSLAALFPAEQPNYLLVEKNHANNVTESVEELSLGVLSALKELMASARALPRLDLVYVSSDSSLDE